MKKEKIKILKKIAGAAIKVAIDNGPALAGMGINSLKKGKEEQPSESAADGEVLQIVINQQSEIEKLKKEAEQRDMKISALEEDNRKNRIKVIFMYILSAISLVLAAVAVFVK